MGSRFIWTIAVAAVVFFGLTFVYVQYETPTPSFFKLSLHLTNADYIGNITLNGHNYNVRYNYFNTSVPQNAMVHLAFHDFQVTDGGYPVYNSSLSLSELNVWMPNNETLNVSEVL